MTTRKLHDAAMAAKRFHDAVMANINAESMLGGKALDTLTAVFRSRRELKQALAALEQD